MRKFYLLFMIIFVLSFLNISVHAMDTYDKINIVSEELSKTKDANIVIVSKKIGPYDISQYKDNGGFYAKIYVEDISKVSGGQIELSSSSKADSCEINWSLDGSIVELKSGWNEIYLSFNDISPADSYAKGEFDWSNANYCRIYLLNKGENTGKVESAYIYSTVDLDLDLDTEENTTRWFEEKDPVTDYAYSFAFVGDTQIVNYYHNEQFHKIYDWLVENADEKKIKFVFGLGDITDQDTKKEWETAKENITKLDGIVPYMLARGNHDSTGMFNRYFKFEDYKDQLSGSYSGRMDNVYRELTVGDIKYLIINIDFGANDKVLEWANEVVSSYPDHNVIVITHGILASSGELMNSDNTYYDNLRCGGSNNGDDIWEKFLKKHENIVLAVCGHNDSDYVRVNQLTGENGNIVTCVLTDPQGIDYNECPTGLICMMYFSEDGKTVQVEYYSTIQEKYLLNDNQFTMTIEKVENIIPQTYVSGVISDTDINSDITVELLQNSTSKYSSAVSSANQEFTLNNVEQGSYDLVVRKPGFLPCIIKDVVVSGNAIIANKIEFAFAGNINGDDYIDSTDVALFVADLGKNKSDAAYEASDINKDTYRDATDVAILSYNLLKQAHTETYIKTSIPALPKFSGQPEIQLHNCESDKESWGSIKLVRDNAPEGNAYIETTGSDCPVICANFDNVDISEYHRYDAYIKLKFYIDNVENLKSYVGFDIWDGSHKSDYCTTWRMTTSEDLVNGWNEVILPIGASSADDLVYSDASMLRVFAYVTAETTIGIDDIRICCDA